jgi:hypothetical protein
VRSAGPDFSVPSRRGRTPWRRRRKPSRQQALACPCAHGLRPPGRCRVVTARFIRPRSGCPADILAPRSRRNMARARHGEPPPPSFLSRRLSRLSLGKIAELERPRRHLRAFGTPFNLLSGTPSSVPRSHSDACRTKGVPAMCDYSLDLVASRPAKVGDKLVTTKFQNSMDARIRRNR